VVGDARVVGLIGLGQMGGPMARTLLGAGWRVVAWDLMAAGLGAAVRDGAEAAADPAAYRLTIDPRTAPTATG